MKNIADEAMDAMRLRCVGLEKWQGDAMALMARMRRDFDDTALMKRHLYEADKLTDRGLSRFPGKKKP